MQQYIEPNIHLRLLTLLFTVGFRLYLLCEICVL